ncbi:MAG: DUF4199 domain-containing protein [Bacteroidetes bacterium]|nr:DUF4199 domain-containing protein [Bacteroidota bacterium]MDA1122235.1 DUF4199 domain-containing protein [Bacteroidota bacterium]
MENGENLEMQPFIIKNGIILGLIGSAVVMATYIVDYTLLANLKFTIIPLVINFALVIYFGRQFRNAGSGFLTYGKAFKLTFFILIVASVMGMLFQMLLYNVLDPDLPQMLAKEAIANAEGMFRSMGMEQSQIDAQAKIMEKEMPATFSPMGQLKNSWAIVLFGAIIASITSIFVKKNEPIVG